MSLTIALIGARGRVGVLATDLRWASRRRPGEFADRGAKLVPWGTTDSASGACAGFTACNGCGSFIRGLGLNILAAGPSTFEEARSCVPGTPPLTGWAVAASLAAGPDGRLALDSWSVGAKGPEFSLSTGDVVAVSCPFGLTAAQHDRLHGRLLERAQAAADVSALLRAVGQTALDVVALTPSVSVDLDIAVMEHGRGWPLRIDARELARVGLPGGLPWSTETVEAGLHIFMQDYYEEPVPGETAGTVFGSPLKLSAYATGITALKDGEILYASGHTFNSSSTDPTTQAAAIRSANIRSATTPPTNRNVLKSVHATVLPVVLSGSSWFQVALDYQVASDLVRSLHVAQGLNSWNTNIASGEDGRYTIPLLYATNHSSMVVIITPYDDVGGAGGSGNAGPPVRIELESGDATGSGTRLRYGGDVFSADSVVLPDDGSLGVEVDEDGRPNLGLRIVVSSGTGPPADPEAGVFYIFTG